MLHGPNPLKVNTYDSRVRPQMNRHAIVQYRSAWTIAFYLESICFPIAPPRALQEPPFHDSHIAHQPADQPTDQPIHQPIDQPTDQHLHSLLINITASPIGHDHLTCPINITTTSQRKTDIFDSHGHPQPELQSHQSTQSPSQSLQSRLEPTQSPQSPQRIPVPVLSVPVLSAFSG